MVEGGGFEPPKLARQIYSLIPLATREPLLQEPQILIKEIGCLIQRRHFMGITGHVQSFRRVFLQYRHRSEKVAFEPSADRIQL